MPIVTINDIELEVPEGTLILDAARKAGYKIPTFCYQADLIGIGSCRMCLVKVEGQQKLIASCVTPVMDGMKVFTEIDEVLAARADMLEFLLANHGLDCPVCDKGGECELQDMVYDHGPYKGRYAEQKYSWHDKDYIISPVIIKNSNRCVQCMKCVRVCKEVVGQNVLDGLHRGERQEETTFFRGMLDCDQDGNCIEVCPVGCFMRLPFRYKTRPWNQNIADTICPYCATGCRMVIEDRDGTMSRSRAQLGVGINSETLCARGRFGYDIVHHADRLTEPMLKKDGRLQPVSWDEALAEVGERLRPADPAAVGGIASARLTNEELYLFQRLFRNVLGSANIDSSTRWRPEAVSAFIAATQMTAGGVSVFDVMDADCVLVVGTHLSDENPVTDYMVRRMARENNTDVAILSPRAMKLDSSARLLVRHRPAAEREILEAAALSIGRYHPDQPAAQTEAGQRDLKDLLRSADIDGETVDALADRLNRAEVIGVLTGSDLLRFPRGAAGLASLTGLLRRLEKDIQIVPVLDRCNQRGAWEMGVLPGFGPGYRPLDSPGLGFADMLASAEQGDLRSLYVVGEDLPAVCPDPESARRALAKLDFLIVQDAFLTETARMADCVLPGAAFAEKEGTFTNQEGRAQTVERLMRPPGKAKRDFKIITAIARCFDPDFASTMGSAADIFAQIRAEVDMYTDVELTFNNQRNEDNELDQQTALVGAAAAAAPRIPVDLPVPTGDDHGSFTLVTGNHLFHSGRLSRRSAILNSLLEAPTVEMSSEDAADLQVADGDRVRIVGSRHKAELTVKVRRGSRPGVVFVDENFESTAVNRFFQPGNFSARVDITPV